VHNFDGLDMHLGRNGGLALVVIAGLEVAVGRVPVKGRKRRLVSIDGNAQHVVGIRHDIGKVCSHGDVPKLRNNLIAILILLNANDNIAFGAVVHLGKGLAGFGGKDLANGGAVSAVVCLDDLQAHGIRVGAGRRPISVLAALVHFAQLSSAVNTARGVGAASEIRVAGCRENELAIGLVGVEGRTSIAVATLEGFALDAIDAAITACRELKAPNSEVKIATGSTARVQGKDSRDGQKREKANDRFGSHDGWYFC
jgi:predicted small secreted protein